MLERYFKTNDLFSVKTMREVEAAFSRQLHRSDYETAKQFAVARIELLEQFFNQGVKLDWSNKSQKKYYPYFEIKSGGQLSFYAVSYYDAGFNGAVGFFATEAIAKHVGTNFVDVYEDLIK